MDGWSLDPETGTTGGHVAPTPARNGFVPPRPTDRSMPTTCALCRRVIPDGEIPDPAVVQEHHLRPERRAESPTVQLCRPCHDQIHAVFTNAELREAYDSVDALRSADRLQGYLEWIRGTDTLETDVATSNRVRERRD